MQVPPSGTVLAPSGGKVTQVIRIANSLQGTKPIMLRVKVDYVLNGAPVSDMADVSFPPTL